jgi:hypothetical protein
MATFQASLKTLSAIPCSLAELVTGMNRYACTNSQGGLRFTTAFLAEYDPRAGRSPTSMPDTTHPFSGAARRRRTIDGRWTAPRDPAEAGYESGSLVLQEAIGW